MGTILTKGSPLWFVTGWSGNGKPTQLGRVTILGETPRRWLVKADDMLWKVPKPGGLHRMATGRAGARRDFFLTEEAARNYLHDLNPSLVKDAPPEAEASDPMRLDACGDRDCGACPPEAKADMSLPTVYAHGVDGRWHAATTTYQSAADTKCGRHVDATEFSTSLPARAERCACAGRPEAKAERPPAPLHVGGCAWFVGGPCTRGCETHDISATPPAPSPLEVVCNALARLHAVSSTPQSAEWVDEAHSALATLEESVRRDERAKALGAVHPGVVEMLEDEGHKGHRFHWAVKCLTCMGK